MGLKARVLAAGTAKGTALVLGEPLSLWGGMDPASGVIIERRHPQHGVSLADRVVIMANARGSSSAASVLAEAARAGVAPAAIILGEPDLILAIGSVVAAELYGVPVPIVVLERGELSQIREGEPVRIGEDGQIRLGEEGLH